MKQRKDGRWLKVKTINGKQVYFYSTEPTERKALKDIENQMLNYQDKEEKGLTFLQVANLWRESPQYIKLSPTTQKRYDILIKHAQEFHNTYIKEITAEDIQCFLSDMVGKDYASKTIKHQFSIFAIIFKFAKMKRFIKDDETSYVILPEGQKAKKRRALTEEEVKTVEQFVDTKYGFLPYFLLYTGLRRGEALALKHKDIDRKNKIININKSAYYDGSRTLIKTPKTEAGFRDVIIPNKLIDKIPKGHPDEYLFGSLSDPTQPMPQITYRRLWQKYLEETKLNVTAHMFRHTYATILFEANIGVKDAQALMGHADITTTNNIYTHIRESRRLETAQRLEEYFNK